MNIETYIRTLRIKLSEDLSSCTASMGGIVLDMEQGNRELSDNLDRIESQMKTLTARMVEVDVQLSKLETHLNGNLSDSLDIDFETVNWI